jgi:hypothetical protein
MLARLAGRKAEKVAEERAAAEQADAEASGQIEDLLTQLHARCNAIKAKPVMKPKNIMKKQLLPNTELLNEPPTGFRSGLRPDGIVEFILDDDNELVASGSGTHLDLDPKKD